MYPSGLYLDIDYDSFSSKTALKNRILINIILYFNIK